MQHEADPYPAHNGSRRKFLPLVLAACVLSVFALAPRAGFAAFMISWTNKGTSGFDAGERNAIDAAIASWERLITDLDGNLATADVFSIAITEVATAGIGAVTSVTEDANLLPSSATMILDNGTHANNFGGFFVDLSPNSGKEFNTTQFGHYGTAKPGFAADGKIDYLSVVIHELGHALGFSESYTKYANASDNATGVLTYGPGQTIDLLGTATSNQLAHLSCAAAPFDLMCSAGTFDNPATPASNDGGFGDRRRPNALNLDILAGIYGFMVDKSGLQPITLPEPGTAVVFAVGLAIMGIGRWILRRSDAA
jgi:hypothetical protein